MPGINTLFTLRLCDATIKIFTGVVREIVSQNPKFTDKIMVIPNGVIQEEFFTSLKLKGTSLRDELNFGRGEKLLACVGRLSYQKGQDILVKAIGILKAKKIQTKRKVR
jgi:glycosyltransferase involved in cell wall biosynthesis